MKQPKIKACLTAMVFGVIVIFSQPYSKGETAAESNGVSDTVSNSTPQILWIADEKKYQGECDTNGLGVVLQIFNRSFVTAGKEMPPTCTISMINASTNFFGWCWKGDKTNLMKIELTDSKGQPVEKTAEGLKYGNFLTEQQYEACFKGGKRPAQLRGYASIPRHILISAHMFSAYDLDSFSLPELFKITQPGEYTLRVQIRMGQMDFPEKKLKRIIMPQEVSAKIQLQKILAPGKLSTQTNSPPK